jgi:histidinol dehydrogenase
MPAIHHLDSSASDFWQRLDRLLAWEGVSDEQVLTTVTEIIAKIRRQGDEALLDYTRRLDRLDVATMESLEISATRMQQALESVPTQQRQALQTAAERIRNYAEHQKLQSWEYKDGDGSLLGQQITALDRVGLYVPGGKASYPSSVLMNAIPAKVAGVAELIMAVPTPDGEINELVLAAAAIAGVNRVFAMGGAQAVAAMAYGTQTVPAVDKIVGPGNIYVATAKRLVYGTVGIDMIAGPSEILIVCDGATDPDWIAMDLFSQAEHDEDAQAILVCPDAQFINRVEQSMETLLESMPRADIIRASLSARGALIEVRDLSEAVKLANYIAPEHLELSVAEPEKMARQIRHAGAIFMGRYTAEALGDYCAGPNHVLPTSRTARFSSPLGVYDFQKRSTLLGCSSVDASRLGEIASILAEGEGLIAHARSAQFRIQKD